MTQFVALIFLLSALVLQGAYPPVIKDARVETYREVDEVELKVWIVGEKVAEEAKPAVVLFFGGGWRFGSPDSLLRHARYLAGKGMVCLLADYRVANRHGAKIADCVTDAKAAVAWTRANAKRLGVDPDRIAAGGASAGGHIAACAALVPGFGNEEKPNALLLFNPPLMLAPFEGDDFGVKYWLTARSVGAEPRAVSPIHHLCADAPPTWIGHGTKDILVPIRTAQAFRDEMKKKGVAFEFLEAEQAPHAFHYRDPWFSKSMLSIEIFLKGLGWLAK
ncbi:MAG: alpha/beta hydrolase [Roseibacillus sp.]